MRGTEIAPMSQKVKQPISLLKPLQKIAKVALTVTLTAVLACEPILAKPSAESQFGGTLRLGWYRQPAPFDPFNVTETITAPMMELIFNRLVRVDVNGDIRPDLAERWEISKDGLIYTFYLHPNVQFQDGEACTSKDVLKTFQLYRDESISPRFKEYFSIVESWTAPEPHIFRIKLKQAFSPFLNNLVYVYIVPRYKLRNPHEDMASFIKNPIGTGPFKLVSKTEDKIQFEANEDYFEGRPLLDQVAVTIYSTKNLAWSAFLRGETDVALNLERIERRQVAEHPDIEIFTALGNGSYALMFNHKDPLLAHLKVRKAIALAINRSEIVAKVEDGEGMIVDGPFHPNSWAYDDSVKTPFDPSAAKSLLLEEGFEEEAGVLKKDGKILTLEILVDRKNERSLNTAKLIRQQLQEIGVRVQLRFFLDYAELMQKFRKNKIGFQSYLLSYGTGSDPNAAGRYWETGDPTNYGKYSNKQIDALFQEARILHQPVNRAGVYQEIHRLLMQDYPAVFLYVPNIYYGYAKGIHNLESSLGPVVSFHYFKQVYFEPSKRR